MAFPADPLDLRVELQVAGTWTDATPLSYQREGTSPPAVITRGRQDETSQLTASQATFELDNRDGRFSPKNPLGPYYGSFGRNTPARLSVPAQSSYLRLEAPGARAYVNDTGSGQIDVTGSIDLRISLELTDWQGCILAAKWDGGGCWYWVLNPDGTMGFAWYDSSVTFHGSASTVPVPYTRGQFALRVTLDATTGNVTYYTGTTVSGTWTQLGGVVNPAGATSIAANAGSALVVGWSANPLVPNVQMYGRVAEFQVLDGIGGTAAADAQFSAQAAGSTGWTDGQGNAWVLSYAAEVSDRDYRFHGELAALPPKWDPTGADQSVPATAGGVWRRLGQGQTPVQSPMRRALTTRTGTLIPVADWPCEDAAGATGFGSATGGPLLMINGPAELAQDSSFPGSQPLPQLNGSTWHGKVPAYAGAGSVVLRWLCKPGSAGVNGDVVARVNTTGTATAVDVTWGTGGTLTVTGWAGGTQLFTAGPIAFGSSLPGGTLEQPLWFSLELRPSGSGISYAMVLLPLGTEVAEEYSGTVAGTVGNCTDVYIDPSGAFTDWVMGHVCVQADWVSMDDQSIYQPFNGWNGETAAARFARLCGEEGIAARVTGSPAASAPMGVQGTDTLQNLLQSCEDADAGQLYEPRQVLGLGYRALASMCSQPPAVTVAYGDAVLGGTAGGGGSLEPTYDDQLSRNDWTVTRGASGSGAQGATVQVTLDDGSEMSVSQLGDYSDSLTANLEYDSQAGNLASWKVNVGTADVLRWPAIPFNLRRAEIWSGSLYYPLLGVDVGDQVEVSGLPQVISYDPAAVLAWGFQESLGGYHHQLQVNGVPQSPYVVALYDDAVYGRADTAGSQLASAAAAADTTLQVTTTAGPAWTTSAADVPFDVQVGGERCTVTAVGAQSQAATRFGAYLDQAAYGTSGWPATAAAFTSITGISLNAARWYAGTSYTAGAAGWTGSLATLGAAGTRICLDVAPTTTDPTQLSQLDAFLAAAQAQGADVRVSLFHEPYYGGLSAAQFQAIWNYYAPTIRKYFQCWAVFSGNDAVSGSGYMPDPSLVDGIAADCYATNTADLVNCQALADSYGKPLGLWEFSAAFDLGRLQNGFASPVNSAVTLAASESWFTSVQGIFAGRQAAGLPNGDILLFTGGTGGNTGSGNFLGTSLSQLAGFEGGTATWATNSAATIAGSTAQAHSGTGSLAITTVTAGTVIATHTSSSVAQGLAVTAGRQVIASCWTKAGSTARVAQAGVKFYNSAGTLLGATYDPAAAHNSASAWTFTSVVATAPANTVAATFQVQILSTAVGEVHYLDDVQLGTLPASGTVDHTGPVQFPWDWRISYIAAIQAAFDDTGLTGPQPFTVTRAVNGVAAAHPSGTDVRLWIPPRYALT